MTAAKRLSQGLFTLRQPLQRGERRLPAHEVPDNSCQSSVSRDPWARRKVEVPHIEVVKVSERFAPQCFLDGGRGRGASPAIMCDALGNACDTHPHPLKHCSPVMETVPLEFYGHLTG